MLTPASLSSTVREALTFSALLRQPASTPKAEKLIYVEEVITLLEMGSYAEAIVGDVGMGLNVEQRKRLTIGVELAAKPALLVFLDEPSSGLDSQSSWSILQLLRKLADHGQAILATIHQPSGELFNTFDRLLLLKKVRGSFSLPSLVTDSVLSFSRGEKRSTSASSVTTPRCVRRAEEMGRS